MLKPMPSAESPVTSPEMGRRRYNYYNANTIGAPHMHQHSHGPHVMNNNNTLSRQPSQSSRFSGSRSSHEIGRGYPHQQQRGLYLELERERSCMDGSPPSDNVIFDNQCYATTPSSSNGNSDQDQPYAQRSGPRHPHHHQVLLLRMNVPVVKISWIKLICQFSITESAKCHTDARFANVTLIVGIRNALKEYISQRNGCRIVQSAHIRGITISKYGKFR